MAGEAGGPAAALVAAALVAVGDDGEGEEARYRRLVERWRRFAAVFGADERAPDAAFVLDEMGRWCGFSARLDARDDGGRIDPYALAFNEGQRALYLRLLAVLKPPRPPGRAREHEGVDA
jgi:hypothetical protein